MSKLLKLVEHLESIPQKERHANIVGALVILCRSVEEGTASLKDIASAARNASTIIGRDELAAVKSAIGKTVRPARKLRKAIERRPEEALSPRADEVMTIVNEQVRSSKKALNDKWRVFVDGTKRDYGALASVGREARLTGAANLAFALQAFETATNALPTTAVSAQKVRDRLDGLKGAVRDLGLEGDVGVFMVAAAEGRADPQDLFKPSVKAFLDSRPEVWRLLKIKL